MHSTDWQSGAKPSIFHSHGIRTASMNFPLSRSYFATQQFPAKIKYSEFRNCANHGVNVSLLSVLFEIGNWHTVSLR
jgi:hypothetical protein